VDDEHVWAIGIQEGGTFAVTGTSYGTFRTWNLMAGSADPLIGEHSGTNYVSIVRDARLAVSVTRLGVLCVWDTLSGERVKNIEAPGISELEFKESWTGCDSIAVTPDGRVALLHISDGRYQLWDLETATLITAGCSPGSRVLAITPDARQGLSYFNSTNNISLWDVATGHSNHVLEGHASTIRSAAVTRDGCYAVSSSDDKSVRVWDLTSGKETLVLGGHDGEVWAVAVTPDGKRAISGDSAGMLYRWDLESGQLVGKLRAHRAEITSVALTADGRRGGSASNDRMFKIWDLDVVNTFETARAEVSKSEDRTFKLKGKILTHDNLAVCQDGYDLGIWDMSTLSCIRSWRHTYGSLVSIASSVHGAVGFFQKGPVVRLVNLETLSVLRTAYMSGEFSLSDPCACSKNGRFFVAGTSKGGVILWDTVGGVLMDVRHSSGKSDSPDATHGVAVLREAIDCVAVSDDGRFVAAAFWNAVVLIWRLEQNDNAPKLSEARSASKGPKPGRSVKPRHILTMKGGSPLSLQINCDSGLILCGTNRVLVWSLETGKLLWTLNTGTVFNMTFVPGSINVVASGGDTLGVWDLTVGDKLANFTLDCMIRSPVGTFGDDMLGFVDDDGHIQTFSLRSRGETSDG
jgi:WD40 repeat protein